MKIDSLIGEHIVHKTFGSGIIKDTYDIYLEVEFTEKNKKSKFMYPSCFDGYVILENRVKQKKAMTDLEQWKVESGVYTTEEMRQEYEKTQQEIRERRMAAEEKKLRAAKRSMEHRAVYQR